jgi:hypothetical protein
MVRPGDRTPFPLALITAIPPAEPSRGGETRIYQRERDDDRFFLSRISVEAGAVVAGQYKIGAQFKSISPHRERFRPIGKLANQHTI